MKYAVYTMYPNYLAKANLYSSYNAARCAKYYRLHGNDYASRYYGRPIAVEIVKCETNEDYDKFLNEFFNKICM